MKLGLINWAAIAALLTGAEPGAIQRPSQPSQAPERMAVATQQPRPLIIPEWREPTPRRLGVFTVLPPERRGEMVHVSVPIGDLAMRATRAIAHAQHRRAEQKARKEVERAVKDFQGFQAPR